jgi:predicted ATPase/DNA-binding SARP family transcriptional activator
MLETPWRIELFGGLRAVAGPLEITRFRSYRTGILLAYLAHHVDRPHSREGLIEMLWPEAEPEAGQTSLRTALSSLRRQLEPPAVPPGSVLAATRSQVRLNAAAISTDTAEFEAALRTARAARTEEREAPLIRALELYRGPLLPGGYEDWILTERERLETAFLDALGALTALLAPPAEGQPTRLRQKGGRDAGIRAALEWAHHAASAAPLREEPRLELMRLYEAAGQPGPALRQYEELERALRAELDVAPSPHARAAAARLRQELAPEGAGDTQPTPGRRGKRPAPPPVPAAALPAAPAAAPVVPQPLADRLPPSLNRFFGRDHELGRLLELLAPMNDAARVVTITGPGGTGKTRLAVEAARRLNGSRGRWFVPLADLTDPRLIPGAVLDALGVPRSAGIDPMDQLAAAVGAQPGLMVLDNYEQLAPAGAPVVQSLLERLPGVTCLVTSRRRLALPGERQLPVRPLPAPDELPDVDPADPEDLLRYPSVQLFVDRAQAVCPDFQVTKGNAGAVAALCRRLEGIPLAIELAAARAQALTPAQMLERLEAREGAALLARRGGEGTRHGSLWAAIDWSYDLLTAEQRRFFARLSVFRGGCTAEAAAEVCEEPGALEYLAQLRERSLITAEEAGSGIRFRLLEALREYAFERLAPEERSALGLRHAEYFRALAEQGAAELTGPGQADWLARLQAEHDNLRAAIRWSLEAGEAGSECGLLTAAALFRFWVMRGFLSEGREHLSAVLSRAGGARTVARAKALNAAGVLAQHQGDTAQARALYEEALAICRELGERKFAASALGNLGTLAYRTSDYALAWRHLEESTAIRRELGDCWGVANNLNVQAIVASYRGDLDLADRCYGESLALFREVGDRHNTAMLLGNRASLAEKRGDDALAEVLHREALGVYREIDDREDVTLPLAGLASIACKRGDYDAARGYLEEGLTVARKSGSRPRIALLLSRMGSLALETGDPEASAAYIRESLAIYRGTGSRLDIAVLLESLAHLTALQGRARAGRLRAARLFGAAEALRERIGAAHPASERAEYEEHVAAARSGADPGAWAAAWAEGRSLSIEAAIDEALG